MKRLNQQKNEKGSNIIKITPYVRPSNSKIYEDQLKGDNVDRIVNTLLKEDIGLDETQKRKVIENYLDLFPASALKQQFKKRGSRNTYLCGGVQHKQWQHCVKRFREPSRHYA